MQKIYKVKLQNFQMMYVLAALALQNPLKVKQHGLKYLKSVGDNKHKQT